MFAHFFLFWRIPPPSIQLLSTAYAEAEARAAPPWLFSWEANWQRRRGEEEKGGRQLRSAWKQERGCCSNTCGQLLWYLTNKLGILTFEHPARRFAVEEYTGIYVAH